MKFGEAYISKLDKWLIFCRKFSKSSQNQSSVEVLLRKHGKCIKKWKETKQLQVQKDSTCQTLASFATADRYDLEGVLKALDAQDRYTACELTNDAPMKTQLCNALHFRGRSPNEREDSHVYCFDVGTVVMWNLTYCQREEMLKFLESFEKNQYGYTLSRSTSELLAFKYTETNSSFLYDNTLYFGVAGKPPDLIGLNRYLISSAISLSTKMTAFEEMIDRQMCSMEKTAARIKAGKRLKVRQKQVLRIAGMTCATKFNLKISTDSLLLPCELLELYESNTERESFTNTLIYFNLPQRMEWFDNNMGLCECYVNLLLNHFTYRQQIRNRRILWTLLAIGGIVYTIKVFRSLLF